jgi:DNA-binding LacI/PurR family transcriptional regulator
MPVTLQDVADAAGFSVPTVSRVLSHSTYPVSETARLRIEETAKQLGYTPNLAARSLRTERTGVVGVLVDDIVSPFAPLLVRGIQDVLTHSDYTCLIINSDWNPDLETSAIHGLLQRPVDGIIFAEYSHLAHNERLEQSGKPHVFAHRLFSRPIANSVVPDDFGGARLAVQHLVGLGHSAIGYINGIAGWHSAEQRKQGFLYEMAAQGLAVRSEWIEQSMDWEIEGGYAAMQRMLALPEPPTALFAANDLIALGAIYAVQDAGLRVPQDVAIVGYDNRDLARFVRPRLTTVEMPVYEMGQAAAELLLQQIHGAAPSEESRILGRLYVRESTGAPVEARTQEDRLTATDERRRLLNRNPES